MTKHTPGPWAIKHEFNVVRIQTDRLVAACGGHSNNKQIEAADAENRANTRLIAAAPDLLAALHLAAEALDAYSDVNDGADGRPTPNRAMSALQDIGEVLAKAEGR